MPEYGLPSASLLRTVIDACAIPIVITARDAIVFANRAATATLSTDLRRFLNSASSESNLKVPALAIVGQPPFGEIAHVASVTGLENQAVIFVYGLQPATSELERVLRRLFALTEAEAKLARHLYEGLSAAQIAAQSGVQLSTVRTHLKQAFKKTQTRRQTQLVRVVTTVACALSKFDDRSKKVGEHPSTGGRAKYDKRLF